MSDDKQYMYLPNTYFFCLTGIQLLIICHFNFICKNVRLTDVETVYDFGKMKKDGGMPPITIASTPVSGRS